MILSVENLVKEYKRRWQTTFRLEADFRVEKPEIVGLNKSDAIAAEDIPAKTAALAEAANAPVLALSGATGAGVREALRALKAHVLEARARRAASAEAAS